MIRMEMTRTEKDAAESRLKKYQQTLTGKGDGQHEQHGSSEGVRQKNIRTCNVRFQNSRRIMA